jgi:crotonobetainyl-CoA hydratase
MNQGEGNVTRHVEITRDGPVIEIRLNKPKVNAIDHAMSRELGEAFATLRDDPELRVAILTAAGDRIFSAGWDLKALDAGQAQLDEWWTDGDYGEGGFAGLTENWALNKPVVVALNGLVIGGGFELAMAADLIIAAEHVEFALPEMPLGMVPDAGAIQRLPRRIPYNIAMEMLLMGRRMGAEEAARYGLVNKVVAGDELMECARSWAGQLAEAAPLALQTVKEVLRAIECRPLEDAFRTMRAGDLPVYRAMLRSEDAAEGVRAFVEKRKPVFKGR